MLQPSSNKKTESSNEVEYTDTEETKAAYGSDNMAKIPDNELSIQHDTDAERILPTRPIAAPDKENILTKGNDRREEVDLCHRDNHRSSYFDTVYLTATFITKGYGTGIILKD